MRKTIIRKMKENSGASLVAALLYFLFCIVLGSILVAAASSASGRVSGIDTGAQERFDLVSASRLLAERMGNRRMTSAVTLSENYEIETEDPETEDFTGGKDPFPEITAQPGLKVGDWTRNLTELEDNMAKDILNLSWGNAEGQLFYGWNETLDSSDTPANRSWKEIGGEGIEKKVEILKLTPKDTAESEEKKYGDVYARIEMDGDFQITAYLYTVTADDEEAALEAAREEDAYRKSPKYLVVRIPANNVNVTFKQVVDIKKKEMPEAEEEEEAAEEEEEEEIFILKVTRSVKISEISWKDAQITVVDPAESGEEEP